jgi:hypothetical protein
LPEAANSQVSQVRFFGPLLLTLALILAATVASAQTYNYPESIAVSGGGTLTYTYQIQDGYCGGSLQTSADMWENFSYTPAGGSATALGGSIDYVFPCGYYDINGGWDYESNSYSSDNWSNELSLSYGYCTISFYASQGSALGTASLYCPPMSTSTFDPLFKITSILYSPPGNYSSQGYGTGTTNGTTTTVSSSFSFGQEFTFSSKFLDWLSASAKWGYETGNTNSTAFTQTWTNAVSYASNDNSSTTYNPSQTNVLNHLLDTFEIWLNPQVTVYTYGSTPASYTASSQPVTMNGQVQYLADVLPIPALTMQAQPAGVTPVNPSGVAGVSAVQVAELIPVGRPQENGTVVYQPGLGAICKNNALYQQQLAAMQAGNSNPGICTQANQCGCTPADFATIMEQNPLLGYNSSTYTASPVSGTVTPLAYDASGEAACGFDQPAGYTIPSSDNCRYVIVPNTGTNSPIELLLNGAQSETYTQSDSTTTSFTTTATQSYNTGFSVTVGPAIANLRVDNTWTWTDSEGIGTSTGGTNTMDVTLDTTTANCSEYANLYEDTLYHTYVFQTTNSCP